MQSTLFAKLAVALVTLSVILSVVLALALRSSHERFHQELQQQLFGSVAATLLSDSRDRSDGRLDRDEILGRVRHLAVANPGMAAFLLSERGDVLLASHPHEELRRHSVAIAPIREFIAGPRKWPLTGDDPLTASGRAVFSAAHIEPPADGAHFLYVVLDSQSRGEGANSRSRRSYSLEDALWVTLANVAAALLAALIAVRIITNPLGKLRRTMEAFEDARFGARVRYGSRRPRWMRDEIDRLGEIFDAMADRIALQIKSLQDLDEERRNLFANIFHDLRTPLTAIRGYVDTLLGRRGLDDSDRVKFLEILRRQTGQVSRLVDQIMELARLDTPAIELKLENLPLDELVIEALAEIRPLLEHKGMDAAVARKESSMTVMADPELVRRALKNLLDNAMRASPQGGRLDLEIAGEETGVALAISDRGPGIRASDIERIFQRFSRGVGPEPGGDGAGIGLAIVRRIMDLHGGSVHAENRAGGGATFRLRFPRPGPVRAK